MKESIRIMALDFGEKRIGLAVSDPLGLTAQPLGVLERKGKRQDADAVTTIAREKEVTLIIIGLPLHMGGEEGDTAHQARKFGRSLEAMCGLPIEFLDERLTTVEAERLLIEADVSRKDRREVIDQMAAQLILQKYLDQMSNSSN